VSLKERRSDQRQFEHALLAVLFFAIFLPLAVRLGRGVSVLPARNQRAAEQAFRSHFHAHKGEVKMTSDSKLMADSDSDSDSAPCHATTAAATPTQPDGCNFKTTSRPAEVVASPSFSSALARAPDRPQWLRRIPGYQPCEIRCEHTFCRLGWRPYCSALSSSLRRRLSPASVHTHRNILPFIGTVRPSKSSLSASR
jgi:hypothetical protein